MLTAQDFILAPWPPTKSHCQQPKQDLGLTIPYYHYKSVEIPEAHTNIIDNAANGILDTWFTGIPTCMTTITQKYKLTITKATSYFVHHFTFLRCFGFPDTIEIARVWIGIGKLYKDVVVVFSKRSPTGVRQYWHAYWQDLLNQYLQMLINVCGFSTFPNLTMCESVYVHFEYD